VSVIAIKNHMMQVKRATLAHLCQIFGVEPDTVRCLLSHWIKKGKIRRCMKDPACGKTCGKCSPLVVEMYEWVNELKCMSVE